MAQDTSATENSGQSIADALSALKAIESVLGADTEPDQALSDFTFEISLEKAIELMPDQYLKDDNSETAGDAAVTVTVDNLFSQLKRGRVKISVSELAYFMPSHMVSHDAFEDKETKVNLPLATVVQALNPQSLKERTTQKVRQYHIEDLRDPFAKPPPATPAQEEEPSKEITAIEPPEIEEPVKKEDKPTEPTPVKPPAPEPEAPPPEPSEPEAPAPEPPPPPPPEKETPGISPIEPPPVKQPVKEAEKPSALPVEPVHVPAEKAKPEPETGPVPAPQLAEHEYRELSGNVNINTASIQQLMTLNGMTPLVAKRILEHRTQKGPFKTIFDLQLIPRLGRKTFKQITGMPYTRKRYHRSRKLASLLKIPVSGITNLGGVAQAISRKSGFEGCIISGSDGLLIAQYGEDKYAEHLSAVAMKITRQMRENIEFMEEARLDSISVCNKKKVFTIVSDSLIALVVFHSEAKITKSQLSFLKKVEKELAWLLSHRASVGPVES